MFCLVIFLLGDPSREAFGAAMMKRWLEKAEIEIGTNQILLNNSKSYRVCSKHYI